jgi:O-Antigen ligase
MPLIDYALIFILGFSLWFPGISIYNIGTSGGIQICIISSILLALRLLIKSSSGNLKIRHAGNNLWSVHGIFLISLFLCTIFSSVGVERSIQSLFAELIGLLFSLSLSLLVCSDRANITIFHKGFWQGGLLSSLYAIYQVIGLKSNMPFTYMTMNNPSFSILDAETAQYHARSLGFTPEPSILASLLLALAGMGFVNVLMSGSLKNYLQLSIIILGFLSTSSQSISILPMYLISVFFIFKSLTIKNRRAVARDYVGIIIVIIAAIVLYINNPSIISTLSRLSLESSDFSESNASAASRFSDITTAISLFTNNPIVGNGLGAYTDLAEIQKAKLNLDGPASAASGLFRLLSEQGLLGLLNIFIITKIMWPNRIFKIVDVRDISYNLSIILSLLISISFFVGYRNLYHLWLLIPLTLHVKCQLGDLQIMTNEKVSAN